MTQQPPLDFSPFDMGISKVLFTLKNLKGKGQKVEELLLAAPVLYNSINIST